MLNSYNKANKCTALKNFIFIILIVNIYNLIFRKISLNFINFFKKKILKICFYVVLVSIIFLLSHLFNNFNYINQNFSEYYLFSYNLNILGLALLYSGIVVGLIITFLADTRSYINKVFSVLYMFFFFYAIWLFINESNILNLFLYYELFLLPSFFIVYFLSPNRRSVLASIYFLTWTQFGSLLVLIGVLRIFYLCGTFNIENGFILNDTLSAYLIFFGFGIKIPMWPFYYWLTKTHVEASSFFSIYLSGFLVKTAVYLFIKFYNVLTAIFLSELFLVMFVVGVVDSSIKMWHQTDLKKLIAYTTVQEMNFLVIPILFNDYLSELIISSFIVTHCVLSSLLFFYIDIITKRYNTRSTSQITGLVHNMPTFSFFMFLTWLGFSGLPYTIKFTLELNIFNTLMCYNTLLFLITIFSMNVIGLIGFSKNLFNTLFGAVVLKDYIVYDLTKRETFIFLLLLSNLITFNTLLLIL